MKQTPSRYSNLATGPSHPLALAALGLLLLNDWVFKALWPSPLTGKLSDIAWLIVMPVAVAAALSHTRIRRNWIRPIALVGPAVFFMALQLWPAFGTFLAGLMGGTHTADPTDLLTLFALFLVPICWKRPQRHMPLLVPVALIACIASGKWDWDKRYPCDEDTLWDPNVPMFLHYAEEHGLIPTRSAAFNRSIRVFTENGQDVDVWIAAIGGGNVVVCPKGGLEPSSTYLWTVDSVETDSVNTWPMGTFERAGLRSFTTDSVSDNAPIESMAACSGVKADVYSALRCDDEPYHGDTGDTGQ